MLTMLNDSQWRVGGQDLGWHTLADCKLLILVGVTGVGKSTTVEAVAAAGLSFALLPNRRDLTDRLIIPVVQRAEQLPVEPVRDRSERFALTRRYRELHAGGMAYALTQIAISAELPHNSWLVFDGLRGANEVTAAAKLLPNARFLVLDAPHAIRLRRLLGRGDAFDQIAAPTLVGSDKKLRAQTASLASSILTDAELDALLHLVESGDVSAEDLLAKLKIVSAERANYDPASTIATLQKVAPSRTFLFDTVTHSPQQIAADLLTKL